jgi:hypothetical protein
MKKILTLATFIFLFGLTNIFASGNNMDTLILLDGKIITGTIEDQSMQVLNNLQLNINSGYTQISQSEGKPIKVQNKDVDYFIINGVRFGNRKILGANHSVRLIVEGEASIYVRSGTVLQTQKSMGVSMTTFSRDELTYSELLIKGKPMPYSLNIPYITKNFAKIFEKCPALIEESKKSGFDFGDIVAIARKYNACF